VAQVALHELERNKSITQICYLIFTLTPAQYLKEEKVNFYEYSGSFVSCKCVTTFACGSFRANRFHRLPFNMTLYVGESRHAKRIQHVNDTQMKIHVRT